MGPFYAKPAAGEVGFGFGFVAPVFPVEVGGNEMFVQALVALLREPVGIGGVSHPPLAKATNWNRESPTELFYDVVALCGEAREYRKWNRRGASDITSRCFPCGDFFGFVSLFTKNTNSKIM